MPDIATLCVSSTGVGSRCHCESVKAESVNDGNSRCWDEKQEREKQRLYKDMRLSVARKTQPSVSLFLCLSFGASSLPVRVPSPKSQDSGPSEAATSDGGQRL